MITVNHRRAGGDVTHFHDRALFYVELSQHSKLFLGTVQQSFMVRQKETPSVIIHVVQLLEKTA